jgi:hypothetical protein
MPVRSILKVFPYVAEYFTAGFNVMRQSGLSDTAAEAPKRITFPPVNAKRSSGDE